MGGATPSASSLCITIGLECVSSHWYCFGWEFPSVLAYTCIWMISSPLSGLHGQYTFCASVVSLFVKCNHASCQDFNRAKVICVSVCVYISDLHNPVSRRVDGEEKIQRSSASTSHCLLSPLFHFTLYKLFFTGVCVITLFFSLQLVSLFHWHRSRQRRPYRESKPGGKMRSSGLCVVSDEAMAASGDIAFRFLSHWLLSQRFIIGRGISSLEQCS